MDNRGQHDQRKIHPRETAGLLSLLTFGYTATIYKKAFKNDFEEKDLHRVLKQCKSKTCGDRLELQWNYENKRHIKPSIIRLLWGRYGLRYSMYGFCFFIWKMIKSISEPPAMMNLIAYFKEGQKELTKNDAIYYACLVLFLHLFDFVFIHNFYLFTREFCMEIRNAFSSLIYRKSLKLTPEAADEINVGNIVTLITKDVFFLEEPLAHFHDMWVGFVQIIVLFYMLYNKLGPLAISGIVVLILFLSLQIYLGRIVAKLRINVDRNCGKRIQETKQTLSAIKIIKMYTWENYFNNKISDIRRKEINLMLKEILFKFLIRVIGNLTPPLCIYVLIMTHVWIGDSITTEIVFYIVSCFRQIRVLLVRLLPTTIAGSAEFYGATVRIKRLLHAAELHEFEETITDKPLIYLKDVTVKIGGKFILRNVSLNIKTGLICITGPVGSGKSCLLKTILRDYPSYSGNLSIAGQISYASQEPWIFPSTIKQNIIFGNNFNKSRYQNIIKVCALDYDLKLMEKGDETLVLEKGGNLSKGQQIRINLARALYRDSDIYLLDDCLSSLDNKVKEKVFVECIRGFLKDKLCLYVTQDTEHLQKSDKILVLENGEIKYFGESNKISLDNLPTEHDDLIEENEDVEECVATEDMEEHLEFSKLMDGKADIKETIYYEAINKGNVSAETYWKYIQFGRGFFVFSLIIILYIFSQVSESYSDKLLTKWVDLEQKVILLSNETKTIKYDEALQSKNYTLMMYSIFLILTVIVSLSKMVSFFNFARVASIKAHKTTVKNVLNAEMHFFDTHLLGNILNRFSEDINNFDEYLPHRLNECLVVIFSALGVLILTILVNWTFVLPILILAITIYVMKLLYTPSGRSLKRLEASTRSPLVGHINATLDDLTTIRAFRSQQILIEEFDKYLDTYTSAHYTLALLLRALGFFIDVFTLTLIFCIVVFFLVYEKGTTAGNVGLAITQIFMLSGNLQWGLRMWADLQNHMISVERILQYTNVKQEKQDGTVLDKWPKNGAIKYENVNLTYPNCTETVLKNINFEIKPNEKVGIIGRTGSGKSSLISVLFRLYDIDGKIFIDGVDIKTLSLKYLRQHLDIIPQNPMLFTGTVRSNIDPLNEYHDEIIWSVIDKMKIKYLVPDIYMPILENGSNFTSGQKQLICLARAIVRQNKIIILDEITANMDEKTEKSLIETIKEHFTDRTVITIAHRLKTILDCDTIIVFNGGQIVEKGSPEELIKKRNGYFSSLIKNVL